MNTFAQAVSGRPCRTMTAQPTSSSTAVLNGRVLVLRWMIVRVFASPGRRASRWRRSEIRRPSLAVSRSSRSPLADSGSAVDVNTRRIRGPQCGSDSWAKVRRQFAGQALRSPACSGQEGQESARHDLRLADGLRRHALAQQEARTRPARRGRPGHRRPPRPGSPGTGWPPCPSRPGSSSRPRARHEATYPAAGGTRPGSTFTGITGRPMTTAWPASASAISATGLRDRLPTLSARLTPQHPQPRSGR